MSKNKIGIITVTKKGVELGKKIKKLYLEKYNKDIVIFTLEKFSDKETEIIKVSIKDTLKDIFQKYFGFIFITATGIAVRSIASFIESKDIDPCVLVIDENGDFVIPILSGHLGGGNNLTKEISSILKALPILTTSSDISGKIAVDTIAMKINGKLESLESAKKVTSLIVAGEKIEIKVPENISNENPKGIIIISNQKNIEITQIFPKNISIGVGCKRGTPKEKIISAIKNSLEKYNLSEKSLKVIGTVDIKKDEIGIIEASKYFNVDLKIISKNEIKKIEGKFQKSEFVEKTLGIGAVSGPCAVLASGKNGEILAEKIKYEGITISIFQEETRKDG